MAQTIATIAPIAHYTAHIIASIAAVGLWYPPAMALSPATLPIIIIGSLLPDADTWLGLAHRTVSHSIAGIAIVSLLAYAAGGTVIDIHTLTIAYSSHIALDLLHGIGLQLLWPSRRWYTIANLPPTYIAGIAAIALMLISRAPSPPLAAPTPPTPTLTRTPTPTPTLTPTRTPTLTLTPTYTDTPDYWHIEILRLAADNLATAAAYDCHVYGQHNPRCISATIDAAQAHAAYCRAIHCPPPTSIAATLTPAPTSTPTLTSTPTPSTPTPTLIPPLCTYIRPEGIFICTVPPLTPGGNE